MELFSKKKKKKKKKEKKKKESKIHKKTPVPESLFDEVTDRPLSSILSRRSEVFCEKRYFENMQ